MSKQVLLNVLTAVLVTEALRPRLAPGGTVINISSIAAHRPGAGSYSAAKAAVEAWNLSLAQDLGPDRGMKPFVLLEGLQLQPGDHAAVRDWKPFKRFPHNFGFRDTWLKPGVHETRYAPNTEPF